METMTGAENPVFEPNYEDIELLTRSPLSVAVISTLSILRQPENHIRVISLLESPPGEGKSSFVRSLSKILVPEGGGEFTLHVTNGPDLARAIQDIREEEGHTYAYVVDTESVARAKISSEQGNYPLIAVEEVRGIPIVHSARLLYELLGNPRTAMFRYIGLTNPTGQYLVPDPLAAPNMAQRFGEPVSMTDLKNEPLVRQLKKEGRTSGYRKMYRIEPIIDWDEDAEDQYEFLHAIVERAVAASGPDRGIPESLRGERQAELFAAHVIAAKRFLAINGIQADVLAWTELYRAIASMRFGVSGAATIMANTDESLFPLNDFLYGDDEKREQILSRPHSRVVAYSIRMLMRSHVRQLATALATEREETRRKIVALGRKILEMAPRLENHPAPVAPVLKRAMLEIFFGETEFTAILINAGMNPADVLAPYTTRLRQTKRTKGGAS